MTSVAVATNRRTFSQSKETQGSETYLANVIHGQSPLAHVEAYAMGIIQPKQAHGRTPPADEILVNNTITQGRDIV